MGSEELKILFVEDSPEDVELELRELRKAGISYKSLRVEDPNELLRALSEFKPDLVISDYSLPRMDGMKALKLVKEHSPEVPFIFVSGTIGEERAIESMKNGATDYVVKDRLGGLVVRVRRAVKEAQDRKERRRIEEQLQQAQKMEAVGRLAGGVAHDFNNLLTAILGYSELALSSAQQGSDQYENIQEVINAGRRASSLTRQLLAFSRKHAMAPQVLCPNQVVADLEKMLRRLIGEDVQVVTSLAADLGNVKVDAGQLEQVIMNLAVNSRDAMPSGGTLSIETRNVMLDDASAQAQPGAKPGPHVMLAVSDTGHGMDSETMSHLFEPFFTTKELGKGTGLGLSMVYGIVHNSEGFISVQSEVGRGTTFRVYLPAIQESRETSRRKASAAAAAAGGETVMVVEDAEPIRRLMSGILTGQHYKVLLAFDGEEALRVAEQHPGPIQLLITDIVMPRMGGTELSRHLLKKRPEVKILFTSGYTDRGIPGSEILDGDITYLQKPFTSADLIRKVRDTLDAK